VRRDVADEPRYELGAVASARCGDLGALEDDSRAVRRRDEPVGHHKVREQLEAVIVKDDVDASALELRDVLPGALKVVGEDEVGLVGRAGL